MREERHTFWAKRDLHKMVAKFWSPPWQQPWNQHLCTCRITSHAESLKAFTCKKMLKEILTKNFSWFQTLISYWYLMLPNLSLFFSSPDIHRQLPIKESSSRSCLPWPVILSFYFFFPSECLTYGTRRRPTTKTTFLSSHSIKQVRWENKTGNPGSEVASELNPKAQPSCTPDSFSVPIPVNCQGVFDPWPCLGSANHPSDKNCPVKISSSCQKNTIQW
jgi:hypothetical protein